MRVAVQPQHDFGGRDGGISKFDNAGVFFCLLLTYSKINLLCIPAENLTMRILLANHNPPLTMLIEHSFARFKYQWDYVDNGFDAFQKITSNDYDLLLLEFELPRMQALEIMRRLRSLENFKQPPVIILTRAENDRSSIEKEHFPKTQVISRPVSVRTLVEMVQRQLRQGLRVACLGGGTGLFTLLSGLKTLPAAQLTSIVSMSDDGGSTGRLRDMFGILPPGDIRRSLVALSTAPDLLNQLMQFRFDRGQELEGHNLGNLLLTALSEMTGTMASAVKSIGEILNIQGTVIPVTEQANILKAELEDGSLISGESNIDLCESRDPNIRIKRLWQEPEVSASPDALEAIYNAQFIILGPGDLFTSIVPNLLVGGIAKAICSSKAKKIYICNVMTKPGETAGFNVSDHVREIVQYLGNDALDYVVCARSDDYEEELIKRYRFKKQEPVQVSRPQELKKVSRAKIIEEDITAHDELVRHDSLKLAAVIQKLIESS